MARQADSSRQEFWRGTLSRQRSSGLSIQRFCQREGLATATFFVWKRRLRRQGTVSVSGNQTAPVVFAPVRVLAEGATGTATGPIEIVLPRERLVRIPGTVDRQQLREVLGALEA